MRRPFLLVAIVTAAISGCIGPSGSHREGYESPTAPPAVPDFNLSGTVVEKGTNAPLDGVKVDVGISSGFTDAEGRYSLPGLRGTFFQVVASREGYDTVRVPIMPFNGNVQVNMTMQSAAFAP